MYVQKSLDDAREFYGFTRYLHKIQINIIEFIDEKMTHYNFHSFYTG